ncbi:MAG: hypothetical protein Q4B69_04770 [Slackia sp.]|nr:hypothetical protein [Slackia sp.]
MVCPKCGSSHVSCQVVSETELLTKHRSAVWWICVGWWWLPFKWLFLTLPALIVKLFRPKRYKTATAYRTSAVCQSCGHMWFVGGRGRVVFLCYYKRLREE